MTSVAVPYTSSSVTRISWTKPEFIPYFYGITQSCHLLCADKMYTVESMNIKNSLTELDFNDLLPGSNCIIKLTAFYNPASIDPGVTVTATTESESTYKWIHTTCELYTCTCTRTLGPPLSECSYSYLSNDKFINGTIPSCLLETFNFPHRIFCATS